MDKQLTTGVVVPLIMLVILVICKVLVKGSKDLSRNDFFLGVDIQIAALTSGLLGACDCFFHFKSSQGILDDKARAAATADAFRDLSWCSGYCLFIAIFLFFLLVIHQKWEHAKVKGDDHFLTQRTIMLLGVSNVVGLGCLIAILYVPKH